MENEDNKQDVIVPEDENLENDELDNLPEADDDVPTVEDYQKALKQIQTLKAQKEHFKKKAQAVNQPKQEPEVKKEKEAETNNYITREESLLLTKGYDFEELEQLNKLSKSLGVTLNQAAQDDMFIAWKEKREAKKKSEQAQLRPTVGSTIVGGKPAAELTEEDRKKAWESLAG